MKRGQADTKLEKGKPKKLCLCQHLNHLQYIDSVSLFAILLSFKLLYVKLSFDICYFSRPNCCITNNNTYVKEDWILCCNKNCCTVSSGTTCVYMFALILSTSAKILETKYTHTKDLSAVICKLSEYVGILI